MCDVAAAVLVVEDDQLIASSLVRALEANGYEATACGGVTRAIERIDATPPDLVLLDLGLPDDDGSVVARYMARQHPAIPVIVLTARADEIDIVLGLEAGAVDYVVKPFRLAELMSRIASHLRMRDSLMGENGSDNGWPSAAHQRAHGIVVDAASRRVWAQGREISLRPKEFDLLRRLAVDAGSVVTREQLIDDVWDENWWGSTKTLDVHINSIRRKLGERAGEPSRITTIRGIGYRFDQCPDVADQQ